MKQPSRARMKLVRALFTGLLGSSLFVVTVQANQVQSVTDSVNRAQTNITSLNVEGSTTSSFQAGPNIAMVQTAEEYQVPGPLGGRL